MLSATVSPLTCSKVFDIIPCVNKISTPVINDSISKRFGLPQVSSSSAFKIEYCKKRDELRRVNGKDPNFQSLLQQIKSSPFCFPSEGKVRNRKYNENELTHVFKDEPENLAHMEGRPDSSYKAQIAELQMRLHEATLQIEITNKENVEKDNKLENQVCC